MEIADFVAGKLLDLIGVAHSMDTRWDPKKQSEIVQVPASDLNPTLTAGERAADDLVSSCQIIDACRPFGRRDEFPAVSSVSPEYRETVLRQWSHLFTK